MSIRSIDRRETLAMNLGADYMKEMREIIENNKETSCGIGSFRPTWLQKLNTPKAFLVNNGILGLLNAAAYSYFIGCISTLEKRYALETKVIGIIMISEEISPIFFGILIGYFGGRSHRTRYIAYAMVVGVVSSLMMASPYFLYGPIREPSTLKHYTNRTDFELCDMKEKDYFCDKFPTIPVVTILFIATFIKGFCCVAFYTIGTPYLDDNVKKKDTSMYFATSSIIHLLGPVFGFLLSSLCLQFYEDPFFNPGYGTDDPRWIGAWWLGYVIIGLLMLIFSVPMLLFPRRFPGVTPLKPIQEDHPKSVLDHLKEMWSAMRRLIKNPILVCHQLGGILRVTGILGYYILMPKYMEMQFKQSASKANLFSGPISLVGMMLGIFLGGAAVRRFKPRPRLLTGSIVINESFTAIALLICMYISCPTFQIGKTNLATDPLLDIVNDCNRDCLCTTSSYTPVCGPDGLSTYFSPCHAGCSSYNNTGQDDEIYRDCKCVHNLEGELTTGDATKSYCGFQCQWLIAYIVVLSLGKFMSSMTNIPSTLVTLRCVDPADKSIALGALSGMYSILAFIPCPLLYGALSDSCCLVWEKSCGRTGNCWIYDTDKFRYRLHGVTCIFTVLGSFLDIAVWAFSTRLKNIYDDEIEPEGENYELKPTLKPTNVLGIDDMAMEKQNQMELK